MSDAEPRYIPLGDSAITVVLGEGISRELSAEVTRITRLLADSNIEGVLEVVPSYASLAVYYQPSLIRYDRIAADIREVIARERKRETSATKGGESSRTIRIPVRYDGDDLEDVAARTGLTLERIVQLHSAREYHVYVIGFVPGFAYMGDLDEALVLPRRATPRQRVPAGSVAIAETQTGIYPFSTPGGWHLIGTTLLTMFDPFADEPSVLRIGDTVIFEPVD